MEKVKVLILIIVLTCLNACATPAAKIETVEVKTAVLYVPKPPVVTRPELELKKLSEEDRKDIGTVSKAYGIDVYQLTSYIDSLEMIYNKYKELSESNSTIFDRNSLEKSKMEPKDWLMMRKVDNFFRGIKDK